MKNRLKLSISLNLYRHKRQSFIYFYFQYLIVLYIVRRVINLVNKEIIKNWGVPEYIKDNNIEFIFDINNLNSETNKDNVI